MYPNTCTPYIFSHDNKIVVDADAINRLSAAIAEGRKFFLSDPHNTMALNALADLHRAITNAYGKNEQPEDMPPATLSALPVHDRHGKIINRGSRIRFTSHHNEITAIVHDAAEGQATVHVLGREGRIAGSQCEIIERAPLVSPTDELIEV